jgi:predicted ATPase/class 3 adenylate cyclase
MEISNFDSGTSERRQVTILNCDIVSSTYISEHSDPEDFRVFIHKFVDACKSTAEELSGKMAGFTGDGIEVYYGHPVANENAANDALLSALQILSKVSSITIPGDIDEPLQVRIGIATGLVVAEVSDDLSLGKKFLAFGTPAHLASRLESAANPGEIYVDELTKKFGESDFRFDEVGELKLKGIEPGNFYWRLVEHRPTNSRFQQRMYQLTPFVGREEELRVIRNSWNRASSANGGFVFVTGEPGIGKSRLVHEALKESFRSPDIQYFVVQCSPRLTLSPLSPWIAILEKLCMLRSTESVKVKREKVQRYLSQELGFSDDFVAIVISMMDLSSAPDKNILDLSAQMRLEIVTREFVTFFTASSNGKPILLVIEDLHWADATSIAMLERLARSLSGIRVQIVITSRTENTVLQPLPVSTTIELKNLDADQTTELIQVLSRESPLRMKSIESIRDRTDGNPLYVEEVTKKLLEQFSDLEDKFLDAEIPNSLQNLLLDRLDQLGNARAVAQVAATIGREFDFAMLTQIEEEQDPEEISLGIEKLINAEIIQTVSSTNSSRFIFHHALFQEAAYESQLKSRRVLVHSKIARKLVLNRRLNVFQPELVAYHYQEAENYKQAFKYWVKAGTLGLKAGATVEAVRVLDNARKILGLIENDGQGLAAKLKYSILRGKALNASVGAKSKEAVNAFRQAGSISTKLGASYASEHVHALDSEFGIVYNSGDLISAIEPAEAMIRVGKQQGFQTGTICGLQSMGMCMFQMGEFEKARNYLEEAVIDADHNTVGINSYPSLAYTLLSHTLYIMGDKQASLDYCKKSISSGEQESPYSHAVSLANSCYLYLFDNDLKMVEENANKALEIAKNIGQLMWMKRALIIKHWLKANKQGDVDSLGKAIVLISELRESNEEIDMTVFFSMIATAQMHLGLLDDATRSLDTAIEFAEKNNERHYLAEVYRHYANLMNLMEGSKAESYREKARALASKQGARAWSNRVNSGS